MPVPAKERKDREDAKISTIERSVLTKAIHVGSDHFTCPYFQMENLVINQGRPV